MKLVVCSIILLVITGCSSVPFAYRDYQVGIEQEALVGATIMKWAVGKRDLTYDERHGSAIANSPQLSRNWNLEQLHLQRIQSDTIWIAYTFHKNVPFQSRDARLPSEQRTYKLHSLGRIEVEGVSLNLLHIGSDRIRYVILSEPKEAAAVIETLTKLNHQ